MLGGMFGAVTIVHPHRQSNRQSAIEALSPLQVAPSGCTAPCDHGKLLDHRVKMPTGRTLLQSSGSFGIRIARALVAENQSLRP